MESPAKRLWPCLLDTYAHSLSSAYPFSLSQPVLPLGRTRHLIKQLIWDVTNHSKSLVIKAAKPRRRFITICKCMWELSLHKSLKQSCDLQRSCSCFRNCSQLPLQAMHAQGLHLCFASVKIAGAASAAATQALQMISLFKKKCFIPHSYMV